MINKKMGSMVLAFVLGFYPFASAKAELMINGGGASLPYPIYSKWFDEYHQLKPDVRINYQVIGSGGGIRQFTQETVDFGATDSPMSEQEISKVNGAFHHIPTVLGGVVPAFNLKGITNLNFTGDVLASIYLGDITNWNDPAIAKINPGVKLPSDAIVVIRRADGSGSTYCFTDYLTCVSPEWRKRVGKGQSVNWPVGLGAKGNEGVSGLIRRTPNAIGYLELVYAKQDGIYYGTVQNQAGNFVKADVETVRSAATSVKMPDDYRVSIVNAPGEKSYPISTFTWILVHDRYNGETGVVLKAFFNWMLTDGQKLASGLDYAPLPDDVNAMVQKTVSKIQ